MFEGSLYGHWQAIVTFQQLIVLADRDGFVDMTPQALSARTSIPIEIIAAGIDHLLQADPYSRTPDCGGRRLEPIDPARPWGWRIINYAKYRELVTAAEKRAADRERIAQRRHAEKLAAGDYSSPRVAKSRGQSQPVADVAHAEVEVEVEVEVEAGSHSAGALVSTPRTSRKVPRGTSPDDPGELLDFKVAYPARSGSQPWRRAVKAARARIAEGHTWAEMIAGATRYAAYAEAGGIEGTQFVMQAATFLGPDKQFLEPWDPPKVVAPPARPSAVDQVRAATGEDLRALGNPHGD